MADFPGQELAHGTILGGPASSPAGVLPGRGAAAGASAGLPTPPPAVPVAPPAPPAGGALPVASSTTTYGTDIAALTDLPDPEQTVSGEQNAAYALARRLLTPTGALDEIGDLGYDSIDAREWLGKRVDKAAIDDLQAQAQQVLQQDPRVLTVDGKVSYDGAGTLTIEVYGQGTDGPFGLVLAVSALTATILKAT